MEKLPFSAKILDYCGVLNEEDETDLLQTKEVKK